MDRSPPRFRICVHRTTECYYARVVELPGCVARGATVVESIENVRGAIRTFLVVARLHVNDTPVVHVEITA
jgi:predicted RNase H-like HicB family nuclease